MLVRLKLRSTLSLGVLFFLVSLPFSNAVSQTIAGIKAHPRTSTELLRIPDNSPIADNNFLEQEKTEQRQLARNEVGQMTDVVRTVSEDNSSQSFSFAEYFDTLAVEEKSKFSWNLPGGWTIVPFGQVRGEMIYAQNPTAADAVQFFFLPNNPDVDDDTFTVHGKTSMLNFALSGPDLRGWETGGAMVINFLGPQPLRNNSGFNVLNAYGYLKRDDIRISFGRMTDLFSPIQPNTVNMGQQRAAGNVGIFRGAFNIDRYIQCGPCTKWTLSGRLSQNTVKDYLLLPTARGMDNGFPNFEGRIGLEYGTEIDGQRPLEIGVSGLWGETRAFDPARIDLDQNEIIFLGALQEVSTTAGMNIDLQLRGPRVGMRGEFWMAQAAGTYFAGILQTLNSETGKGIRSIGGWSEVYYKSNPRTTLGLGGGIDDPRNQDVGFITNSPNDPGQRLYSSVVWSNAFYDVAENFQLGFEVAYRKTHYLNPNASSSGFVTGFSSTLKF
ncbi:MAG: hypothetical protein P8J91_05645 [Pirellulaceae bacterium]|nr:hypothetical protein [Planctomycetaceae bacterium]MDG1806285.1 hypothetical protein [Pirellulaceae bacterium]MDG2103215.1 hypothetical protein [Pirellulaceae bacterium]